MAKAKPKATTAVATTETTELAVAQGYGEYAGDGFDNVNSADLQIPFLAVLQALSDAVKSVAKGGLGADVGQLMNTVTEELYDGEAGVGLVPAITQHQFVEWRPRSEGGGFVGVYEATDAVVKKCQETQPFGKFKTDAGNDLVETFYLFGVLFDLETGDSLGSICVPFASTKIKAYKKITTALYQFTVPVADGSGGTRKINPPLFAHRLKVTTFDDKNNEGDFSNIKVAALNGDLKEGLLEVDSDLFQEAMALKNSIAKGAARAAYESMNTAAASSEDEDDDGAF